MSWPTKRTRTRTRIELDLNADPDTDSTKRCCHTSGSGRCQTQFFVGVESNQWNYCKIHNTDKMFVIRSHREIDATTQNQAILLFCVGHRDMFPPELLEVMLSGSIIHRRSMIQFTPSTHNFRQGVRVSGTMAKPIDLTQHS